MVKDVMSFLSVLSVDTGTEKRKLVTKNEKRGSVLSVLWLPSEVAWKNPHNDQSSEITFNDLLADSAEMGSSSFASSS